jgi:hypothetical protein
MLIASVGSRMTSTAAGKSQPIASNSAVRKKPKVKVSIHNYVTIIIYLYRYTFKIKYLQAVEF